MLKVMIHQSEGLSCNDATCHSSIMKCQCQCVCAWKMLLKSLIQSRLRGSIATRTRIRSSQCSTNKRSYHSHSDNKSNSNGYRYTRLNDITYRIAVVTAAAVVTSAATFTFNTTVYADKPHGDQHDINYTQIRREIADMLETDDWDDGSLGPVFVRLAWHASGTYTAADGTGGSNGGLIRFKP
jgi:catalase (peroxidase I)